MDRINGSFLRGANNGDHSKNGCVFRNECLYFLLEILNICTEILVDIDWHDAVTAKAKDVDGLHPGIVFRCWDQNLSKILIC